MYDTIYHIVDAKAWAEAQSTGEYKHPTLFTEGFIHCSTALQLEPTANRYFKNQAAILILTVDSGRVKPEIKYELATIGELFPHIYGPLNIDAVIRTMDVVRSSEGAFVIPI